MRTSVLLTLAIAAIAASVMYASSVQRTTAETNAAEIQVAQRLLSDELLKEQGVSNFGATGVATLKRPYLKAHADLPRVMDEAFELSSDDPEELEHLRRMRRFDRLFEAHVRDDLRRRPPIDELRRETVERHRVVAGFVGANDAYRARLAEVGRVEIRRASYVPFELVVLLGTLFAAVAAAVLAGVRRRRRKLDRIDDRQGRFGEAMQVSQSQAEAHGLLRRHVEIVTPGSRAVVLNRNNSADRLEPATGADLGPAFAASVEHAEPRACLAVRLSRPFERGRDGREVLECGLCGRLEGDSICQPLLVGGEVIGSLLVEHGGGLDDLERTQLDDSVVRAAPVLANLRNLAIAETRAATDSLTGLPNRRSAEETLKRLIAQAGRTLEPLAAIAIDLDHFKDINDTLGHDRGDQALAGFADMLRAGLRESDFAARPGGEEFLVLLPRTGQHDAVEVAEKLRAATHSVRVNDTGRALTASFGISVYPDDALDGDGLLRVADRGLYAAKQRGRDRVEVGEASAAAIRG